jgi:hypothetical protein
VDRADRPDGIEWLGNDFKRNGDGHGRSMHVLKAGIVMKADEAALRDRA